jgi:hypothetical protein
MADDYSFRRKSDEIIRNLDERTRDIRKASRQIKRAREILRKQRQKAPPSKIIFKKIHQGSKGGLYYLNKSGKRVYLTPSQCKRCVDGRYPVKVRTPEDRQTNAALGCPPKRAVKCQESRADLKREIRRLRKFIEEEC